MGYLVESADGQKGYLKALDYNDALRSTDPPRELERLTKAYNFERDIYEHCGAARFSRVVRRLMADTVQIENDLPISYIIFELADGDARDMIEQIDVADGVYALRVAHHVTVGLRQLHRQAIAHQDLKAANVLVWKESGSFDGKLGDLGRAFVPTMESPHDRLDICGDVTKAPPEMVYRRMSDRPGDWRFASDLYSLGNFICFLVCGGMEYKLLQVRQLDPSHYVKAWNGTFEEVLPYLLDAHGQVVGELRGLLHTELSAEISDIIFELCHPDPSLRGDPKQRKYGSPRYELDRYVTRLDLLGKQVLVRRAKVSS